MDHLPSLKEEEKLHLRSYTGLHPRTLTVPKSTKGIRPADKYVAQQGRRVTLNGLAADRQNIQLPSLHKLQGNGWLGDRTTTPTLKIIK